MIIKNEVKTIEETVEKTLYIMLKDMMVNGFVSDFFYYNLLGGKYNRFTIFNLSLISNSKNLSEHNRITSMNICGLTTEMLQAYFLITDDIIDNSETRRGKMCWYKNKKIGLKALKDAAYLYGFIIQIFFNYINEQDMIHTQYELCKILNKRTLQTWIGQAKDSFKFTFAKFEDVLKVYNIKSYREIVYFKTNAYTLLYPYELGKLVINHWNSNRLKKLKQNNNIFYEFASEMSFLLQIHNDCLDLFPQPGESCGTDIPERKITYFMCLYISKISSEDAKRQIISYLNEINNENCLEFLEKQIRCLMISEFNVIKTKTYEKWKNYLDDPTKSNFTIITSILEIIEPKIYINFN